MKKIYLLLLGLCLIILAKAQVSKTVEVTSGNLSSLLTEEEKSALTSLTLIGTVDARDFITTAQMPLLTELDLSQTRVTAIDTHFNNRVARSFPDTIGSYGYNPRENASLFSANLTRLKLPSTLKAIDTDGLKDLSGLTSLDIPPGVTSIGLYAIWGCSGLTSVAIPSSVTYIETYAFFGCSGLKELTLPPSIERINERTFALCSSLTTLTIPSPVKSIGEAAFTGCTALAMVTLPESLLGIHHMAFNNCPNITTIYSYNPNPPAISIDVFNEVDTAACVVYVPYGSKALYAAAEGWKYFQHIEESLPGFTLSATAFSFDRGQQSATVEVNAATVWTAKSDQSWLTVTPLSGEGSQTLTLSAAENTTYAPRTATVTVSVSDTLSKEITVVQIGTPIADTIDIETAGTLYTYLPEDRLADITRLTLTGEIDVRDFKLIRDKMPFLEVLDLSGTIIRAYSGTEGTNEYITEYKENEVPLKALENGILQPKSKLTTVLLPESVTAIGEEAFSQCNALTDIKIPSSVTTIRYYSFAGTGISEMVIPTSVTTIGAQVFRGCKSLKTIELPSSLTELGNAAFEGCDSLTSVILPVSLTTINTRLFYSCSGLKEVEIGTAVTAIGDEAFFYCISLDSITIPSTVTHIGYNAFAFCYSLAKVYSYPMNPPDLSVYGLPFSNVDLENCILYVPKGTKALYASASRWKDFKNIIEMEEFSLENTTITFEKEGGQQTVKLYSSIAWTASSNEQWLTVLPGSGTGGQWITLTAQANTDTTRTAIVTIYAQGADSLTITVTQHGMTVGLDEIKSMDAITFHPNPFTDQLSIDITNPSLKEVNAEVFSISGQKIKTLLRAQKGAKISCIWNGTNEGGLMMPDGMYLLKVNGEVRKVVKRLTISD